MVALEFAGTSRRSSDSALRVYRSAFCGTGFGIGWPPELCIPMDAFGLLVFVAIVS